MKGLHLWKLGAALALGLALLITSCTTVKETGRKELLLIPASQELQLGITSFNELKKETPINHDPALNALVQKVGKRIAAVADLPNAQWEFVVFDSPEANAFCLPGGKVGVYKGILPITQDEAGLATVIGHEVAHASLHHGAERMSENLAMQGLGQLLGVGLSGSDPRLQSALLAGYGVSTKVFRELPHDRFQESEADHVGLRYMARAGYNPQAALNFWQRFEQYSKQSGSQNVPTFLRTHPVDSVRIQQIQKWLPEAEAQYRPQG